MQATVERKRSILDRPILSYVTLNWELVLIVGIVLIGLFTRYYDLGTRALHHDESIHARWSWDLYQTSNSFRHDPTYHGPFLYYAVAFAYLLFGASDYTSRVAPAFFGMILLLLPLLLRKQLGRSGVLATMFFILISPSIMYYSRALRHDIFALTGTMMMVIAIFRYLDERRSRWIAFFTLGFTISYASHELTFITGYILLSALAIAVLWEYLRLWPLALLFMFVYAAAPTINLPIALVLLFVPLFVFVGLAVQKKLRAEGEGWQGVGPATGAIAGIPLRDYLMALLIWAGISIPLFSTMFNNLPGIGTGTFGALAYWLSQHAVQRGSQPPWYYIFLLPVEEFTVLIFGLLGFVYWAVRVARQRIADKVRRLDESIVVTHYFPFFLFFWFLSSLLLYSWAGEKMPWLVMHIALPLCVLSGWFVGKIADALEWDNIRENGGLILAVLLPLTLILFVAVVSRRPVFGGAPLAQQTQTMQWFLLAAMLVGLAFAIGWFWTRLGGRATAQVLAVVALTMLSLFTVRTAWRASITLGDIAADPLIYVQTTRDVTNVVNRVTQLSMRMTSGKDMVFSYDDESSWPLTWYFRDFKNQRFEPKGPAAPPDMPVVIVGTANDEKVRPLMGNYVRTYLKLRWWFPEFYKTPDEMARTFLSQQEKATLPQNIGWADALTRIIKSSTGRSRLWKLWLYRDLWDPNSGQQTTYGQLGSSDMVVYVRKDLNDSFWSGGPAVTKQTAPPVEEASYQRATRSLASIASFGAGKGAAQGQFNDPKGVAVDAAGNIYVADTLNHRIQKLDATGKFLLAFGSQGEGDGQFNEPWSVAVDKDGSIYVADTWNHRIQKFDATGKFVAKWGGGLTDTKGAPNAQMSVFYGPRSVVVDKDGNILVMDTGNKRVQKFDKDGKPLAQFGVVGTDSGQFNEPVGLAVDKDGNIYVADTWNHRIEKFDSTFKYLAQWPVLAWDSESIVNKPYLATDPDGNVYATDPEGQRVLKFSNTGSILAIWGQPGGDASSFNLPIGIAIDGSGNVYVADALNQRIQKFAPVK